MDRDPPAQQIAALRSSLNRAMRADAVRLDRRLRGLQRRIDKDLPVDRGLTDIAAKLETSIARREARGDHGLRIEFDDSLPIASHSSDIISALKA